LLQQFLPALDPNLAIVDLDHIDKGLQEGLAEGHRSGAEALPHSPAEAFDQGRIEADRRSRMRLGLFECRLSAVAISLKHVQAVTENLVKVRQPLLDEGTERVAGLDLTLLAPKSVSIIYSLAGHDLRKRIEEAQQRAAKATISLLDRHAAFGRRGKNGTRLERVSLAAASFQHSEARPAEHTDGQVFADPNLHTHCVILNLGRRADGTVGALDGRFLFRWKMADGAAYHTALAAELQVLGFSIGEIGKNGVFEISGIPTEAQEYFSEIEQATVDHV